MGEYKDFNDSLLATHWRNKVLEITKHQFPEAKKKDVNRILKDIVLKNMRSSTAEIRNNYIHQSLNVDLSTVYTWIHAEKPILAGFGSFFKNQEQEINPVAVMLDNFLNLRKQIKGLLKVLPKGSYEYDKADREQGNEKRNANSYYGSSGARASSFFNIITAASVTATGQLLISTTEQAFEAFISGKGYSFDDMNECYTYMSNILKEDRTISFDFAEYISVDRVMNRLRGMFYDPENMNEGQVYQFLMGCTEEEITRIYYKNNTFEFLRLEFIGKIVSKIVTSTASFTDPNKPPENTLPHLIKLWSYLKEFVVYAYSPVARVRRLRTDTREAVVGVDTDSNMIYIYPIVHLIKTRYVDGNPDLKTLDEDNLIFIIVNMIAYMMTQMVTTLLFEHTKRSHVLEDFRHRINMKNEFLFWKMIFSNTKKRYITLVRLREGREQEPEMDVKGIDFMKSTTKEATKKAMIDITHDEIMMKDEISVPAVFGRLEELQSKIIENLASGAKDFLIPISVKEIEAYKEPFSNQGIKAIHIWNIAQPNETIELPAKVDMVKVNIKKEDDLLPVRDVDEEVYNRLVKGIFHGPIEKIREKGTNVIAVPQNYETVPDWLSVITDYSTITNDNMSRFNPVVVSLGITTVKASKKSFVTNILQI